MKVYVSASDPSVRVPFREVALTTGERLRLYDTSGPYTDPEYAPDVKQWVKIREVLSNGIREREMVSFKLK